MTNTDKHETYAAQAAGRGLGKVNRLKEEVARQHHMIEHQREVTKHWLEECVKIDRALSSEKEMTDFVRRQLDNATDSLIGQQRYNDQIEMRMVEKNKELIDMHDQLGSIIDALPDLYSPKADVYTFDREELNNLLGLDTNTNKPQVIEINDCGTNPKIKTTDKELAKMLLNHLYGRFQPTGVFYTCLDHYHYAPEE